MPSAPLPAQPLGVAGAGVAQPAAYRMRPFEAVRAVKSLGIFVGFGLAVSGLYATTGIGFPCPLRAVTGWECPLCGGTRLGSSLLHGHIRQAFDYNPVVFIGLIVMTILGGIWIVEALGGPKVRPPRRIADRLVRVHPTVWAAIAVAAGLAYTLVRNLV
ncbi:DUF2752 domain-containing protein [Microlunatus endophyticus]|nr:DUF2752 domain-containing protein [Microlunatus endophyticus]